MSPEHQRHLLLAPHETLEPRSYARLIAPHLQVTVPDETLRLRYCGGWLVEDGNEEQIGAHRSACEALGLAFREISTEGPPDPPQRLAVVEANLEEEHLSVRTHHREDRIPVVGIRAVDLGIAGELEGALPPREAQMKRTAEAMLMGLKQSAQLEGLIKSGLKRPNPVLAIVSAENREIHVIERATRFPELAAAGGGQSLENLLEFIDRLASALADRAILPGLDRFWKKGLTAGLVRHRPEEHTARQKWLHHWYSSEGHQEDR